MTSIGEGSLPYLQIHNTKLLGSVLFREERKSNFESRQRSPNGTERECQLQFRIKPAVTAIPKPTGYVSQFLYRAGTSKLRLVGQNQLADTLYIIIFISMAYLVIPIDSSVKLARQECLRGKMRPQCEKVWRPLLQETTLLSQFQIIYQCLGNDLPILHRRRGSVCAGYIIACSKGAFTLCKKLYNCQVYNNIFKTRKTNK